MDFLMIDKNLIATYALQCGRTQKLYYSHCRFHIALPEDVRLDEDYDFTPQFKMLADVVRGDVCDGRHCVWPIRNQQNENLILVQISHAPGSTKKFIHSRDARMVDGTCKVIS